MDFVCYFINILRWLIMVLLEIHKYFPAFHIHISKLLFTTHLYWYIILFFVTFPIISDCLPGFFSLCLSNEFFNPFIAWLSLVWMCCSFSYLLLHFPICVLCSLYFLRQPQMQPHFSWSYSCWAVAVLLFQSLKDNLSL